ncbi:hypothetical protein YPPY100_1542, partial [Yersinia pestis PY-100]
RSGLYDDAVSGDRELQKIKLQKTQPQQERNWKLK